MKPITEDLHSLPKVRDRLTHHYVEHARIDRYEKSIAAWDDTGYTAVPVAGLNVLMLGPGTTITHAATRVLADNGCLCIWCGEENVRFYAYGTAGTRSGAPLLHQARLASDEALRLEVVNRMYRMRFAEELRPGLTVEQLRGVEGVRVRETYARMSRETGVEWSGRNYDRTNWSNTDPVNRALSCANSCLYGICHAAILATGFSPGLGFIHTGKQLSFVYDIGDLYKTELTIPLAFQAASDGVADIERETRTRCRDRFRDARLLQRIVPDIYKALGLRDEDEYAVCDADADPALPSALWTPASQIGEPSGDGEAAP